jgi:superfamily II DNA or RNA helicase
MPRILDNIENKLLDQLRKSLEQSTKADFCVGYFNLRGWKTVDDLVERYPGGEGTQARVLVGMTRVPEDELRAEFSLIPDEDILDNAQVLALKRRMAEEFRAQLLLGAPNNSDEAALRRLRHQLLDGKTRIKLFLRYPLHAKLYLTYRPDEISPRIAYVGSSNLTLPGLRGQGELNLDVVEDDATVKLEKWFGARWDDARCIDITDELADIIEESWAREALVPPYHIYLKMAYHLSQEARAGLAEFSIPREFAGKLFDFQVAAVKIAAHHLNKRGGVLIGDVVGLGKTLMASALARTFQDDQGTETLIICPKNLVKMWEDYVHRYRLLAEVMPSSVVLSQLPTLRRYRVVLIDESHNLRNPEGKRYRAIRDYIERNASHCILLTATPYNKAYQDLSAQLRLFVPGDQELEIRPEQKIKAMGEAEFVGRFQAGLRSIAAFEKSEFADDWRELMRLYMVRRTRSFIQANYAETDPETGRQFLTLDSGAKSYFPKRTPKTVKFRIDEQDPADQYATLYGPTVVAAIAGLTLPRYGLGNYVLPEADITPSPAERKTLRDLGRAGKRLMGFCRTNLFKRLESGGPAFLMSIERHTIRNFVFLHALEHGLPVPIGTQEATLLSARPDDQDPDGLLGGDDDDTELDTSTEEAATKAGHMPEATIRATASTIYERYSGPLRRRFSWLPAAYFTESLAKDLLEDSRALLSVLDGVGQWDSDRDSKLLALKDLLAREHPDEKVLVFTQFADTVDYLITQLRPAITDIEGVTGQSADPTSLAWRFSPRSNERPEATGGNPEIRVLITTDVLSEGQNLQDCHVVVNFDIPWAIIRLIQRAGRVDRIGQQEPEILCYSFLPADGIERVLRLRHRVRSRLRENAEVVGTDEQFFEDDASDTPILDLYNEKAGILETEDDGEVDLASYAFQIWKNAIEADPSLEATIPALPDVSFAAKQHFQETQPPPGVLVFIRTAADNDSLAWVDEAGELVTQSQLAILRAAECEAGEPALIRSDNHHELVRMAVDHVVKEENSAGGNLGRPSGPRAKAYARLTRYHERIEGGVWDTPDLRHAIDDVYQYPLTERAKERLSRQMRAEVSDDDLVELVLRLREDGDLSRVEEQGTRREPSIICSLGLRHGSSDS